MPGRIHPVILSGGAGTRLWPASRALYPKQFVPLMGARPTLGATLSRIADTNRFAAATVICNATHRFLVAEQIRQSDATARIILEPVARNTAPAACAAALAIAERDPEGLMLLLPSDHVIQDESAFQTAINHAATAARAGYLTTFGIRPTAPETGYGYIRTGMPLPEVPGAAAVAAFVEKPDRATAESFLASGGYVWNSGMFLMPVAQFLAELAHLAPDILSAARNAYAKAHSDLDFLRLDEDAFAASPARSIDYAVMERTPHAAVVPAAFGWSDIGSWQGLWQILPKDGAENAIQGDVATAETARCMLRSDDRLLVTLGLTDMIVVATDDAVMVCPRDRAQDVGELAERLRTAGRTEPDAHTQVFRPWGSYRGIDHGARFQVKRITVQPGAKLSLQRHRHRAEHWIVVDGMADVTRDGETFRLHPNQSTHIPLGAVHRLANPGDSPLHLIEVQCGDYLGEDDIERFADTYGRAG